MHTFGTASHEGRPPAFLKNLKFCKSGEGIQTSTGGEAGRRRPSDAEPWNPTRDWASREAKATAQAGGPCGRHCRWEPSGYLMEAG